MSYQKTKCDPGLGVEIDAYLNAKGVQTPMYPNALSDHEKIEKIQAHMVDILNVLGMDLNDDSLAETPKRVAKMFVNEIYWGLDPAKFPKCTTVENKMGYDEMVVERGIKVMSECEHHLKTIFGQAHVAYIPRHRVLGLSKMPRIVDYFCRRPQIQERLTEQIYHALSYILDTDDIAVVVDAKHMCVSQRGVEDQGASTVTSKLGGCFKSDAAVRAEFMRLISKD